MNPRSLLQSALALSPLVITLSACDPPERPLRCAVGEAPFEGACVEPGRRYEPAERIDTNNVVAFGDPLQTLQLPEPPKRGFRLIAAPRLIQPGEEVDTCISWPFPAGLSSNIIYAGQVYATPGLHH